MTKPEPSLEEEIAILEECRDRKFYPYPVIFRLIAEFRRAESELAECRKIALEALGWQNDPRMESTTAAQAVELLNDMAHDAIKLRDGWRKTAETRESELARVREDVGIWRQVANDRAELLAAALAEAREEKTP